MMALFGRTGVVLVSVFVMISSFSSLNGSMLASPRVFFRDGRRRDVFRVDREGPSALQDAVRRDPAGGGARDGAGDEPQLRGAAPRRSCWRSGRSTRWASPPSTVCAGCGPRCRGRTRRSAIRSCPRSSSSRSPRSSLNALIHEPIPTDDHVRADPRRPAGLSASPFARALIFCTLFRVFCLDRSARARATLFLSRR